MANKRALKKSINMICEALFAECVAVSLYGPESNRETAKALLSSIVKMGDEHVRRVSHPEPGMSPRAYYKDLREKYYAQVSEVLDQINS